MPSRKEYTFYMKNWPEQETHVLMKVLESREVIKVGDTLSLEDLDEPADENFSFVVDKVQKLGGPVIYVYITNTLGRKPD